MNGLRKHPSVIYLKKKKKSIHNLKHNGNKHRSGKKKVLSSVPFIFAGSIFPVPIQKKKVIQKAKRKDWKSRLLMHTINLWKSTHGKISLYFLFFHK